MKVAEIYLDHSLSLVEQSTAVEQPLSPPLLVEIAHTHFILPPPVVSEHVIALYVSSGFIFLDCTKKLYFFC